MTALRGMTWSHPRGYDPLVACSREWQRLTGVSIQWEKRSLQDFESYPIEVLAREFDMIVLDHPHMGHVTGNDCLLPFDSLLSAQALAELPTQFCGLSFESYRYAGRQWALPIDAACQIQAYRPDRLDQPAATWGAVADLARKGVVMCPLRPPHALMTFFTLAANGGTPCRVEGDADLIDVEACREAYELLLDLASHVDPRCYEMDPIAVYEVMAGDEAAIACAPVTFGYVNYGFSGFRPRRLAFADIPSRATGVAGSVLGGTGLAISASSADPNGAAAFAIWVASGAVQRGLYAGSGGQPAHVEAWSDAGVDNQAGGFYSSTRATIEGAWLRPRLDGFMKVQDPGSQRLSDGLRNREAARTVMQDINAMFRQATT